MKILALGGCGEIGRHASKTLLADPVVKSVVIADRDGERAKAFAQTLGNRASWQALDITDAAALKGAIENADIIINTVGPYFRFGPVVLDAAIAAKKHYLDVCDDWEPTLEMLSRHEKARDAGITAILGLGATPGISNILARKAVSLLSRADSIITGWQLSEALPEKIEKTPSAATVHGMHQLTGKIRVFRQGSFVEEKPIRKVKINYPGFGSHIACTIGHPEPVTLPRFLSGIKTSVNVMVAPSPIILALKALTFLVDKGLVSHEGAAWFSERVEGPNLGKREASLLGDLLKKKGPTFLPPLFALAEGMMDGKPASVGCALAAGPQGGMGPATGIPLAIGAILAAQGRLAGPGVLPPEAAIEPDAFFQIFGQFTSPKTDEKSSVLITRSWES
jgi:saccharopine dehydrogenase-like NADP-dependent oxidoreductase